MATYISDDPKLLDELFRKDGEGQLLVGYETGKEKPHAESSYMLYPANPDRQDPVYTFMALFSQQSIKAKYSAFVPNTRLEIYSFPKMTDVPAISGDISKKEYINQVLLPYIREKGLAPLISTNLRNVLFAQSRSDILMISGELPKLTTQQLDELVHFHQKQDELAARYDYNPVYKLPLHAVESKYSINSLVYWVTYVHNVVYSFYRSMIYCYINSTQRCAGSIVIDIIPTNGADKRKFFPFAPYFPVTNVIKRYFYPYFPAIIGIKGYSFPYFPYLSGIMKIKTALYSLFSRLDWHKTVVFPCLGEIYEGIRSLSWEIPVT